MFGEMGCPELAQFADVVFDTVEPVIDLPPHVLQIRFGCDTGCKFPPERAESDDYSGEQDPHFHEFVLILRSGYSTALAIRSLAGDGLGDRCGSG